MIPLLKTFYRITRIFSSQLGNKITAINVIILNEFNSPAYNYTVTRLSKREFCVKLLTADFLDRDTSSCSD